MSNIRLTTGGLVGRPLGPRTVLSQHCRDDTFRIVAGARGDLAGVAETAPSKTGMGADSIWA